MNILFVASVGIVAADPPESRGLYLDVLRLPLERHEGDAESRARNTRYASRMTMLSFRVADSEAVELKHWAQALGLDRSELLREALHRHLVGLRAEYDASTWEALPRSDEERALAAVADWGPAEDWADWDHAAR